MFIVNKEIYVFTNFWNEQIADAYNEAKTSKTEWLKKYFGRSYKTYCRYTKPFLLSDFPNILEKQVALFNMYVSALRKNKTASIVNGIVNKFTDCIEDVSRQYSTAFKKTNTRELI